MNYSFADLTPTGPPFEGRYIPHNQSVAFVYATNGIRYLLFRLTWTKRFKEVEHYEVPAPITVIGTTLQKRIHAGTYRFGNLWTWHPKPGSFDPDPAFIVEGKFRLPIWAADGLHTLAIGF